MVRERYNDKSKLITDTNELQLTNRAEVMIYREDLWQEEIVVELEGQTENFEELKPFIVFVAENLCKMDCIAQRFSQKHSADEQFADSYIIAYISLDMPDRIKLTYYGTLENTCFDVVFQYTNNEFILKSFGTIKDI